MSAARSVYSTGPGGGRSSRDHPEKEEPSEPVRDLSPECHTVRVRLDRSGRKGKQVTVAGPFLLRRATARELLKQLRKLCGAGGTLKNVTTRAGEPALEIEIQGDHTERIVTELATRKYPTRRSGG